MNAIWWSLAALAVVTASALWWWSRGTAQPTPAATVAPLPVADEAALESTRLLVPPPVVLGRDGREVVLRDWLRHEHPTNDHVWPDVVADFYRRAARDPEVAAYFRSVDMESLQRHFLSTLLMVSGNGITVGAVQQMQERHADVRNHRGEPILGPIFERTVQDLLAVLRDYGVPQETMPQVFAVLEPLRAAIVVDGTQKDVEHA